jgi:beta-lactamase class A
MTEPFSVSRRRTLQGIAAGLAVTALRVRADDRSSLRERLTQLETASGGRIGLAVLDTATGWRIEHRADERFAMCSTFKLMLAAAILKRVDARSLKLAQRVAYSRADLLPHSPFTEAHVAAGALPLESLLRVVVELSDNTAANLLLALAGGPAGYTQFLRGLGDSVTRLDRTEPGLNSNWPGDPRDTTSPAAMLTDMQKTLLDTVLTTAARERLLGWMRNCSTGRERLRARLPAGWKAGDKTGTGDRGAVNDLAIIWPPGRPPILIACYLSDSTHPVSELAAVHAKVGALVINALAKSGSAAAGR